MRNKIKPMQLANVSSGAAARVRLALLLTAIVLAVEVVGGLWAHSLALLSDAGHVVTDLVVLALSSFALAQVQRPASARRSFGYQRVGILVALANALLLGAIVVGIVFEAVRRLQHPGAVQGGGRHPARINPLGPADRLGRHRREAGAGRARPARPPHLVTRRPDPGHERPPVDR